MTRDIVKFFLFLISFIALICAATWLKMNVTQTELFDENLEFKSEFIKQGHVEITILSTKRFKEGKHSYSHYVFTDKGRLKINSEETLLNSTLFYKIKDEHLNKTCMANVGKLKIQKDWLLTSISCS